MGSVPPARAKAEDLCCGLNGYLYRRDGRQDIPYADPAFPVKGGLMDLIPHLQKRVVMSRFSRYE
ncbi:hypothetical protein MY8738_005736 [Beauveria namnaoensis]